MDRTWLTIIIAELFLMIPLLILGGIGTIWGPGAVIVVIGMFYLGGRFGAWLGKRT